MPHGLHIARVGDGVTDLDLARPFWAALGFEFGPPFDLGTKLADQSETPGSPLVIQVGKRDGFSLELVQHGGARPAGRPPVRRPLNQLGLTHLALAVDDVDRVLALVTANGGWVHEQTRSGDAVFCADPCGMRVLLAGPGAGPLGGNPGADGIGIAHLGICVADLDRSVPFYEALGFEAGARTELGTGLAALAELDGLDVAVQPLRLDAYPILLLQWGPAARPGTPVRLPLNRVGEPIHLGTHCDDFEAVLEVVVANGGTIVERTRAQFPPPGIDVPGMDEPHGWVFVLDPDGVQIEVVGPR